MIRIEGIPIVAARLEAASKSAGVAETARPVRQPRMHLLSISPKASPVAEECAGGSIKKEPENASMETRSNVLSVAENGDAITAGNDGFRGNARPYTFDAGRTGCGGCRPRFQDVWPNGWTR